MKYTRLALLAFLFAALAVPTTVPAASYSLFFSGIDTQDLAESFGLGGRVAFDINDKVDFDITLQYFDEFENKFESADSNRVRIGLIPIDFGVTWSKNSDSGFTVGGGVSYAFINLNDLELNGNKLPDPGDADDEFGLYGKIGYQGQNGWFVDLLYRAIDVSIEKLSSELVTIPELGDSIDFEVNGIQVNFGYRFGSN